MLAAIGAQANVLVTSVHSFNVLPNGANPSSALIRSRDGNFYGTTSRGGTNGGYGVVLRIGTNGVVAGLYSFNGGLDGANPEAALVEASDGNFYGTTSGGGLNNAGTVFRIGPNGSFSSLCSFAGLDGAVPYAPLVEANDGNFYGTTSAGGTNNAGTVFRISPEGKLTSLYSFSDGENPSTGLVQGGDGNLYGTTQHGGLNYFQGTVFKVSTQGRLTTLHSFTGGNDGAVPQATLVPGSDGSLYGTTTAGGTQNGGTVFRVDSSGVLTTLYSFTGGNDGLIPAAALVQGGDGNFYGTTLGGGTNRQGTVFRISPQGTLTGLYSFSGGDDGASPLAGVTPGNDGSFYGTTENGGVNHNGSVFRITPNGNLTTLYSFTASDGASPSAALVQGSDGSFYGTTQTGGTNGDGTVFRISPTGELTSLHSFAGSDGAIPYAALVQGSDGNFYGTTFEGTTNGEPFGTVFRISATGTFTILYSFDSNDGSYPQGALVQGSDGTFYGTTDEGGTNGWGTVFSITTNGALTTLYSFRGVGDGSFPMGAVAQGSDGNFYGTTSGDGTNYQSTVFSITTNGALTIVYTFTGAEDGTGPRASLVQASDGNFYGTTEYGGTNKLGTVFRTDGKELSSLHSFQGGNDGSYPQGALVQGRDGNLYGTTSGGGTNGYGTLFKIDTNGILTSLYSFTGGNDGANPQAALVQAGDGDFYGTTSSGGQGNAGTVFRLTLAQATPVFQPPILTNGALNLTWSAQPGGVYLLQYTADLTSSHWTNLGVRITAAGATLSAIDSLTNGQQRFYRAVLWPFP